MTTDDRRQRLVVVASVVVAVVVANVVGDAFRLASFADLRGALVAVAIVAALGAGGGAALARVSRRDLRRAATTGALSAALVAFLVLRIPSPWIDLGPFGAGALTTLALVVLPLAQAVSILAVRRWIER